MFHLMQYQPEFFQKLRKLQKRLVKYFTDRSKAVLFVDRLCFVLSCVCYVFVCVCLYVLCGHQLGKG